MLQSFHNLFVLSVVQQGRQVSVAWLSHCTVVVVWFLWFHISRHTVTAMAYLRNLKNTPQKLWHKLWNGCWSCRHLQFDLQKAEKVFLKFWSHKLSTTCHKEHVKVWNIQMQTHIQTHQPTLRHTHPKYTHTLSYTHTYREREGERERENTHNNTAHTH